MIPKITSYNIDDSNVLHTYINNLKHVTFSDVTSEDMAYRLIDEENKILKADFAAKYSKDFSKFLNEVAIWETNGGKKITITSRIEKHTFFENSKLKPYTDDEIQEVLYKLHSELHN